MTTSKAVQVLSARWWAPAHVHAVTTLRAGGVSKGPYESLNLGMRAGDEPGNVAENRRRLRRELELPGEPRWLKQVHGRGCIDIAATGEEEADGGYTSQPRRICAVLTADCLPLFMCDPAGERVGLFHVGWRGLAAGMVETAWSCFDRDPGVHCWLGPAIGPEAFEIGPEVREALLQPGNESCFTPSPNPGRYRADLYGLVARRLKQGGVRNVDWDGAVCTYRDEARFFSHRRSGECGRMASLIWMDARRG